MSSIYERYIQLATTLKIPQSDITNWVESRVKEEREEARKKEEREEDRKKEEREEARRQKDEEREEARRQKDEEREERRLARQHELAKLEYEERIAKANAPSETSNPQPGQQTNNVNHRVPRLFPYKDGIDDVETYLIKFEAMMSTHEYPKEKWTIELMNALSGEALQTVTAIPDSHRNYDHAKKLLLQKFRFTESGYHDRFKSLQPNKDEDFSTFVNRSCNILNRWVDMAIPDMTYDNLFYLILSSRILDAVDTDLASFIKERAPKSLNEMKDLGYKFEVAHPGKSISKGHGTSAFEKPSYAGFARNSKPLSKETEKPAPNDKSNDRGRPQHRNVTPRRSERHYSQNRYRSNSRNRFKDRQFTHTKTGAQNKPQLVCQLCGKKSHEALDCWSFNIAPKKHHANFARAAPPTNTHTDTSTDSDETVAEGPPSVHFANTNLSNADSCALTIVKGTINGKPATVLRDSGATANIVRRSFVSAQDFTGQKSILLDIDCQPRWCDVALIEVESPYLTGTIEALVLDTPYADLTIGNVSGLKSTDDNLTLSTGDDSMPSEHGQAAVTRAMSKNEKNPDKPLIVQTSNVDFDRTNWINEQEKDPSLSSWFDQIKEPRSANVKFFSDHGLLCRKFSKHKKPITQIVVPSCFRANILSFGHDTVAAGHQGICSTFKRVSAGFAWPGMRRDVTNYVQSCHICQIKSPKGRVRRVPLEKMPIIEKPFSTVAIDLVGPLPKSSRNFTHILTFMDYGTRWPEAIPLKNTSTEHVAEALMSICCRLGIPDCLISDNAPNLASDVMAKTLELMGVKHKFVSPYHPQANGLCERANSTLKDILKKVAHDQPEEWDRFIPPVLFAYREIPQASTDFSPFELTFGRTPRGILSVVHDNIRSNSDTTQSYVACYDYVNDLKDRMEFSSKIARENMEKSAERNKQYADRASCSRKFQVGDQVLVLLSKPREKMLMHWKGPYTIVSVRSGVNYEINIENKLKVYHANLLKKYHQRSQDSTSIHNVQHGGTALVIDDVPDGSELPTLPSNHELRPTQDGYSEVTMGDNLTNDQRKEVSHLLQDFADVLTDKPGITNLVEHEINLTSDIPVCVRPYPIPFHARDAVKEELKSLLDAGIVRHSNSPYNSPIVVVKKKCGNIRPCLDFRRINAITVFDAEPIPNQDELFVHLNKAQYFTKMDLSKGYYQIPLKEEHKRYTAFQSPLGLLEFNRLPFGLNTASSSCQRLMRCLLENIPNTVSYFDDICIFNDTWQDHLKTIDAVLSALKSNGLTVKPSKMSIGCNSIEFLGHTVHDGLLSPESEKVNKIKKIQQPKNKKEVRKVLGLLNFYRKYVPDFATIATPLTNLTKNSCPNKVNWTKECQESLDRIVNILSSEPVLAVPDIHADFILRTDASDSGIAGVLLQMRDGQPLPCAYTSRKLSDAESRYSVIERECLAIIYAIKFFSKFLLLKPFHLETDHKPLTYLTSNKYNNSRLLRWSLFLQDYVFSVSHISGSQNLHADLLSRLG